MSDKRPSYIEGLGWRYEVEHSMLRRMQEHDYKGRSIYMVTLTIEGRKPILGTLRHQSASAEEPYIEPTTLGQEVMTCWQQIPAYYPAVRTLAFQLMPDHIHGLLFVTQEQESHLGKIINGFKVGCAKAYRKLKSSLGETLLDGADTQSVTVSRNKHPEHGFLFAPGYQDSVLKGKNQLETMFRYIADNPRRLAEKRANPELFRIVRNLTVSCQQVDGQHITFAAIGNRWLLERPVRLQVRCHNNTTEKNLKLIASQKAYFLQRGKSEGAVIVSPCISAGEKEIARAALDAGVPLVVILENGFPPLYKPPGKYFDACCKGLLLMLAPWQYHMEKRTITRQQCLALNEYALKLSTEPWTQELERVLEGR